MIEAKNILRDKLHCGYITVNELGYPYANKSATKEKKLSALSEIIRRLKAYRNDPVLQKILLILVCRQEFEEYFYKTYESPEILGIEIFNESLLREAELV